MKARFSLQRSNGLSPSAINTKGLAACQESELTRLRAINEELRRQNEEISAARDRYLGLAAELLAQLQQVDTAIQDAIQKSRDASEGGDAAI